MNPSCIIIANNTLHKAYNTIRKKIHIPVPLFHIVGLAQQYIAGEGMQRVLLSGTRFTMEDDYFKQPLMKANIEVIIPNDAEKEQIQAIQSEVSAGRLDEKSIVYFE